LLHDDARHGLPDNDARKRRGSGSEAGPPSSMQFSAVEEKSAAGLGEESERKSERRERGEIGR
jgi:hypothetical protein